jgi:hypothetical protein
MLPGQAQAIQGHGSPGGPWRINGVRTCVVRSLPLEAAMFKRPLARHRASVIAFTSRRSIGFEHTRSLSHVGCMNALTLDPFIDPRHTRHEDPAQ